MDKTLEKVTKDPKLVEAGHKCREKYMNDLKESILNDAKKGSGDTTNKNNETTSLLPIQAMKLPALLTMQVMKLPTPQPAPPPRGQMILMSMALVCLLSLPLVFVYFLHITLFNLKIKNLSMKNRINHQNDVICFRKIYNK